MENLLQDETLFYNTYVKLIEEPIKWNFLTDYSFLKFLKNKLPITFENIQILSNGYLRYIQKPQKCIYTNHEMYLAIDMNTNLHYICYKDVMMIDIDFSKTSKDLEKIKDLFKEKFSDLTYRIYSSNGGYHIFITNKRFIYNSKETIDILIEFECDLMYIICVYLRGFSVRVNKKKLSDNMYTLIYENEKIENEITTLIDYHIQCNFKNEFVYLSKKLF